MSTMLSAVTFQVVPGVFGISRRLHRLTWKMVASLASMKSVVLFAPLCLSS